MWANKYFLPHVMCSSGSENRIKNVTDMMMEIFSIGDMHTFGMHVGKKIFFCLICSCGSENRIKNVTYMMMEMHKIFFIGDMHTFGMHVDKKIFFLPDMFVWFRKSNKKM